MIRTISIYTFCFFLLVLNVWADSQTMGATLNVTGSVAPIIVGTDRLPTAADITENISYYVEAYDPDTDPITAYCQIINGSTNYGSIIEVNISSNVSTEVCSVSSNVTKAGEQWHADIFVGDGTSNTTVTSTLSSSVGAFVSNIQTSEFNYLNFTITFDTAINVNYTIYYSYYNDSNNLNETYSVIGYNTSHSARFPIQENNTFYYNITTFTEKSGAVEYWGTYSTEYECEVNWECPSWGECVGGFTTRICVDTNNCSIARNRPTEVTTCNTGGGGGGSSSREDVIESPRPEYLLAGEPVTCGNGIVDDGETPLNCNRDIKPTILDYVGCIAAGKDSCIYYDSYSAIALTMGMVVAVGGYFIFTPGTAFGSGRFFKARNKRRKKGGTDWSRIKF